MELVAFLGAIACLGSLLLAFKDLAMSARAPWAMTDHGQRAGTARESGLPGALESALRTEPSSVTPGQGDCSGLHLRRRRHIRLLLDLRRELHAQGYRPPLQRQRPTMTIVCCRFPHRARR